MLNVQRFKARIHREGLYDVFAEQNENILDPLNMSNGGDFFLELNS